MDRWRALWNGYTRLPWLARWGVGFALSAGLGITLGVLTEWASYWWALRCGFRPPVEGIPYLRITVGVLTFGMVGGAAVASALVYSLPRIEAVVKTVVVVAVWVLGATGGLFALSYVGFWVVRDSPPTVSFTGEATATQWFWLAVLAIAAVSVGTRIWGKRFLAMAALVSALAVFAGVPMTLLNADYYAALLRWMNFGGGKQVTVTLADGEKLDGGLMVRSAESVVLFQDRDAGATIHEIRLAEVESITEFKRKSEVFLLPKQCTGWRWWGWDWTE